MDLLGGYGSDSDGDDAAPQPPQQQPSTARDDARKAAAIQQGARAAHQEEEDDSLPSTSAATLLFSKLPQPSIPTKRVVNFQVGRRNAGMLTQRGVLNYDEHGASAHSRQQAAGWR